MTITQKWSRSAVGGGIAIIIALTGMTGQAASAAPAINEKPSHPTSTFTPGQPWLDTNGTTIQAHGGQVVAGTDKHGKSIWYWYGEDRTNGYASSPGVHVYSSHDLTNWTDEGLALRAMTSADQFTTDPYFEKLYAGYTDTQKAAVYRDLGTVPATPTATAAVLERPKVIYNAKNKQWVMWVHADGPSATSTAQYAKAQAGVAVSSSPFGPFTYIDSYRLDVAPAGEPNFQPTNPGMARDMNLFVDDDGTAYIIYSSEENSSMFISKLNSDYTGLSASPATAVKGKDFTRPYIGASREAPALFKENGTYYLMTSAATGWAPNAASYATATDILGTWTDQGNPAKGDGALTTFDTQSTSIIPVDPKHGKFIYMGDRWTPDDLATSPYVWLPVTFGESGAMSLENSTSWTLGDLKKYEPWKVTAVLPDHLWLGDATTLPQQVDVTSGTTTKSSSVTWDTSMISAPGMQSFQGTLADGRTFTRSVLVVPHNLRYVVNAGGFATTDWTATDEVAKTEGTVLNSSPEQPLGVDPVSGATWGYTGDSGVQGSDSGNLYSTVRWAKNKATLTYAFGDLAPGTYTVYAGYYDPWPNAGRTASVSINGSVVDPTRGFTGQGTSGAYSDITVGQDGSITVAIAPTGSPDIQVSWFMVSLQN